MIGATFFVAMAHPTFTEMVRQPDAGIDRTFGLSRGQLLSVGGIRVVVVACDSKIIAAKVDCSSVNLLRPIRSPSW